MKTLAFNVFATIMFVGYFCILGYASLHLNTTTTKAETTETNATQTTESAILQDVTISDNNYYYHGEQIAIESDCSIVLDMIMSSKIDTVIPVATKVVTYEDGTKVMYLD